MPSTETALQKGGAQPSLVEKLAGRYGLEGAKFYNSMCWLFGRRAKTKMGKRSLRTPTRSRPSSWFATSTTSIRSFARSIRSWTRTGT